MPPDVEIIYYSMIAQIRLMRRVADQNPMAKNSSSHVQKCHKQDQDKKVRSEPIFPQAATFSSNFATVHKHR